MNKAHLLQVAFVIIEVFAFIPLTIEVFGNMNPEIISICAIIMGIGLLGSCACAIVRVVYNCKSKNK